jgi:hypothetical protein
MPNRRRKYPFLLVRVDGCTGKAEELTSLLESEQPIVLDPGLLLSHRSPRGPSMFIRQLELFSQRNDFSVGPQSLFGEFFECSPMRIYSKSTQ